MLVFAADDIAEVVAAAEAVVAVIAASQVDPEAAVQVMSVHEANHPPRIEVKSKPVIEVVVEADRRHEVAVKRTTKVPMSGRVWSVAVRIDRVLNPIDEANPHHHLPKRF